MKQALHKFLATLAKAFGITTPEDRERAAAFRVEPGPYVESRPARGACAGRAFVFAAGLPGYWQS